MLACAVQAPVGSHSALCASQRSPRISATFRRHNAYRCVTSGCRRNLRAPTGAPRTKRRTLSPWVRPRTRNSVPAHSDAPPLPTGNQALTDAARARLAMRHSDYRRARRLPSCASPTGIGNMPTGSATPQISASRRTPAPLSAPRRFLAHPAPPNAPLASVPSLSAFPRAPRMHLRAPTRQNTGPLTPHLAAHVSTRLCTFARPIALHHAPSRPRALDHTPARLCAPPRAYQRINASLSALRARPLRTNACR